MNYGFVVDISRVHEDSKSAYDLGHINDSGPEKTLIFFTNCNEYIMGYGRQMFFSPKDMDDFLATG